MDITQLKPIVEAMIFVAEEPISETQLLLALAETSVDKAQIRECVCEIEKEWNDSSNRGIGLRQVAGGWQFHTKAHCAEWLKKLSVPKPMKLSGPALETLAIVAYRQPIVRSEVEKIRGVDSGAVLKTLLDRRLLRIVGRRDEPGQPLLYGTTKEFLEVFNLKGLTELPTLKDIEDLMRERRTVTEPGVQDAEASAPDEGEEPTEVIEGEDDEEETQVIRKRVPDEDDEGEPKEEKDMEALGELENSLKSLRKLERGMFPKMHDEEDADSLAAGGENAQDPLAALSEAGLSKPQEEEPGSPKRTAADESGPDAARTDDSPFD